MFTLSGFGDEIAADLDEQLDVLKGMGIDYLELRGAWGKNVVDFDEDELKRIKRSLESRDMHISAIGSPIGKVPVDSPFEPHLEDFRKIVRTARFLETGFIRIFSFYLEPGSHDRWRDEVMRRIGTFVEEVENTPLTLLHENERDIYGDIPERCADILCTIDSPKLDAVYDPANFICVGVEEPFDTGWPLLSQYVKYVHVKDALRANHQVVPAGEGDAQVRELLLALKDQGGDYFLSLEPHLVVAGQSLGFSGPELFQKAADALRRLLAELD